LIEIKFGRNIQKVSKCHSLAKGNLLNKNNLLIFEIPNQVEDDNLDFLVIISRLFGHTSICIGAVTEEAELYLNQ